MKLRDWIRATPPAERAEACAQIGTTMDYLWQIAGGHCRAGAKMAVAIEDATGVSKHDLRPDIFGPNPHSAPAQRPSPTPVREATA